MALAHNSSVVHASLQLCAGASWEPSFHGTVSRGQSASSGAAIARGVGISSTRRTAGMRLPNPALVLQISFVGVLSCPML